MRRGWRWWSRPATARAPLHPDDWVDAIGPLLTAGGTLGGVFKAPVIKSASVAAGTGYVGAWGQLVVWLRSTDVFGVAHPLRLPDPQPGRGTRRAEGSDGVLAPAAFARVTGL